MSKIIQGAVQVLMGCISWRGGGGDVVQHLCKTLKDKGDENPPSRDSPSRAAGPPL